MRAFLFCAAVLAVVLALAGPAAPTNGRVDDQFIFHVPGSSCTFPSCFPDATNTGVPAGTTLTTYSGPTTITTPNTVIDSKTVNGCLDIQTTGVVIKNSRLLCTTAGFGGIVNIDDCCVSGPTTPWVTVQDSELACGTGGVGTGGPGTALSGAFMIIRRVNIYGCENGASFDSVIDMQDSYVHDLFQSSDAVLYPPDGTHTDAIQFGGGHYTIPGNSGSLVSQTTDITIKHNTLLSMGWGAHTPESDSAYYTTSAVITNSGGETNTVIDQNLVAGGAYTMYCPRPGSGTNFTFTNNHFTTRYKSSVGYFGTDDGCANETTVSGNVYHESGLPVTLSYLDLPWTKHTVWAMFAGSLFVGPR